MAEKDINDIKKLFKEIKSKVISDKKNIPDNEIAGKIKKKDISDDLIPLDSIFSNNNNENSLSSKISSYMNSLNDSFERDTRYERYKLACRNPEVEGALDIYASETATQNSDGGILNVFCSNEKVKEIINNLFKRIHLEDKSYDIIKSFCAYGDEFYEIIFSKSGDSIHSINQIPRELIGRKEINGTLENFYVRKSKKIKDGEDSVYSFDYSYKTNDQKELKIDPIRILHWRIPSTDYAPYGKSILDSVITPLEELRLMEQSLLIARITRAPERRVFYINVGSSQGERGIAMARETVSRLKRKNILDKISKNMDSNIDFFGAVEDITIPFRVGEEKSSIESLPQLNDPGTLTDLDFIRDRIFPGLGIPRTYLFDDTFANSNSNLSNKSVAFSKRIKRIQKFFLYQIHKLAFIELKLKGIKEKDFSDLLITLNNPSTIDERERVDIETLKWGLISNIKSMNSEKVFYPDFLIYKDVLNLSNDEMLQLMIYNLAQESGRNPFSMIPEDQRPKDWLILDQLKTSPAPEGGGEGLGDEDGDGIPDEAEDLFGEAPPEGEENEAPPEEAPAEEPEVASFIQTNKNKEMLNESLKRVRSLKEKFNKKELKTKKFDSLYSYSELDNANEFRGLKRLSNKNIIND